MSWLPREVIAAMEARSAKLEGIIAEMAQQHASPRIGPHLAGPRPGTPPSTT
ncbi:MAG: hypothetical protein ACR2NJ_00560 [Acidimicrobiales bacterium]